MIKFDRRYSTEPEVPWTPEHLALKERLLMMKGFDVKVHLCKEDAFFEMNPHLASIHGCLGLGLEQFRGE